jgi:hypothetical protein
VASSFQQIVVLWSFREFSTTMATSIQTY